MNGYLLGLLNDYLLIKEGLIIVRQIRKPTRQVCGVGIHVFCDRDIKRTLNNQEYPAKHPSEGRIYRSTNIGRINQDTTTPIRIVNTGTKHPMKV